MSELRDTSPETERVLLELARRTPPWRKWELVAQMTETVRMLALAGLRRRFPQESEERLRRRLAGLLYGEELARKAYGPLEEQDAENTSRPKRCGV